MTSFPLQASTWRVPLSDLSQACRILAHHLDMHEGDSRRVQWDLQPRVIRYYTTLGLLDRAHEKRGKFMYYGARHLFQLLSIKKLQGMGLSLAQIQARLLGSSDQEMADFLQIPAGWLELVQEHHLTPAPVLPPEPPSQRNQDFWMRPGQLPPEASQPAYPCETVQRFRLANGVEVTIPQHVWDGAEASQWFQWLAQAPA